MPDAVLFDLDGTLIDTEALALRSQKAVFAAMGQPVDDGFLHGLIGKDGPASGALIRAAFPGLDFPLLERLLQDAFRAEIEQGLPLKPGAAELLAWLGAQQIPMAIATSSGRESAARKLRIAGIAAHFTEVVVLEDVARAKPAPDPYLLAASRLHVDPARCLAFEDSEPGAEAAFRAGCTVVQVPDVLPASGRWAAHVADNLLAGARAAGLGI